MTTILTTTSGLLTYTDIASIDEWTEHDQTTISLESFNPKIDPVVIDKKKVLLIQVTP